MSNAGGWLRLVSLISILALARSPSDAVAADHLETIRSRGELRWGASLSEYCHFRWRKGCSRKWADQTFVDIPAT